MRIFNLIILTAFAAMLPGIPGCGDFDPLNWSGRNASDYLGIPLETFGDTEALTIQQGTVGAASTEVTIPQTLLESAPDEAVMMVEDTDVTVTVDESDDDISPAGANYERHAAVTFRIASHGSNACESGVRIGPFGITVVNEQITLTNESVTLSTEAREIIRTGSFGICAQTLADFDGELSFRRLSLEFGSLRASEEKVELCHIPAGNPDNRHTINVGASAQAAHLAHGDYLGPCRDLIEDLKLTSVCSDDPETQLRWRVRNPNDFDVDYTWELYQGPQTGLLRGTPGDTYFYTDRIGDADTVIITWRDATGEEQTLAVVSTAAQCLEDADEDDVPDADDLCADTPSSETADSDGCSCSQRDTDADGVCDCDDECPNSTSGATVDESGCEAVQLDEDGDGVINGDDDCPDTPSGETPDESGCSCSQRDGDADGVNDCDDECPETSLSESVGDNGCPLDELDSDNDGVLDDSDACLSTPAGEAVDANGCSCSQLDEDDDGVNNCNDLCPQTPTDTAVDANGCEVALADAGEDVTLDEVGCVTLQGFASGGTEPYTYSWSAPGWEGSMEQNPTVVPAETTTYTLTVSDWSVPPIVVTDDVTITINTHDDLQYEIVNLGSLSNNASYPSSLNDAGQVVGYYYTDDWLKHAFLFSDGVMSDLGTLGGNESYARDINEAGEVVGQSHDAQGNLRAFIWNSTDGMSDLGTLGGDTSAAYGVNEDGEVVGQAHTGSATHAFLYRSGTMSDLDTTEYFQSGAFDINDDGLVVGTYLAVGYDQQVFLDDAGTFIDLGSPLLSGSRPVAINSDGMVTGFSWGTGEYRSFLYACETVTDLGALAGFPKTYAWDMSDSGRIVGYASTTDGTLSHAFIYAGGQLHDLNDLLISGHGWEHLTVAFGINSLGQIAGYGRINGEYRAFLLTPTP